MTGPNVPFVPPTSPYLLPSEGFEALIGRVGQRVSWMKSHTCPCVFGGAGAQGFLPMAGTAQPQCLTCFGVGTYWDAPSSPFQGYISFMHLSTSPDEPGVVMNQEFGPAFLGDPVLTVPHANPYLGLDDPGQPTTVWDEASTNDIFVPIDMAARYTAVLQVGPQGIHTLPYQQNLRIAPSGAVTIWDPVQKRLQQIPYYVYGPIVLIGGAKVMFYDNGNPITDDSGNPFISDQIEYDNGTQYMVEFTAAPLYVAFRRAGGLPHVRPFGGGTVNEPKRFRLQALDYWTRQRGIQPTVPGTNATLGGIWPLLGMQT